MTPQHHLPEECKTLAKPGWFSVALAVFLVGGILVSYLPQHVKIIVRRSSDGLSPWWVLLGGLSSVAAIGNIMTLPKSRRDVTCCSHLSHGQCAAAVLGVVQIGVQFTCFLIIVVLYITFYSMPLHTAHFASAPPLATAEDDVPSASPLPSRAPLPTPANTSRREPLMVGLAIFPSIALVTLVSIVLVSAYPHRTQAWADALGTIAGVLAAIQYIPQIYFTYRIGGLKSLSVLTLLIQAPGAFLFAFSLYLRVGVEGWSTWVVYLVTGLLQMVLLFMAFNYWSSQRLARNAQAFVHNSNEEVPGEESPQTTNGHVKRASQYRNRQANGHGISTDERTVLLSSTLD